MQVTYANEETKLDPEQLKIFLGNANQSFKNLYEFGMLRKPSDSEQLNSYSLAECEDDFKNWVASTRELVKDMQAKSGKVIGEIKSLDNQYANAMNLVKQVSSEVAALETEIIKHKQAKSDGFKITTDLITKAKAEAAKAAAPMPKLVNILFKLFKNEDTAAKDAPKKMTKEIVELIKNYKPSLDFANLNQLEEARKALIADIDAIKNNAKTAKLAAIYEPFMECTQNLIAESLNLIKFNEKKDIYDKVY